MKQQSTYRALFETQVSAKSETRTVDVIASTPAVDACDRVVVQDWNLDRFKANPVVLWNHGMGGSFFGGGSDDSSLPIGFATNVRVEDGNLKATLNFVDEKANPIAEKVWQGFLQGSIRAVSVGWDCEVAEYDDVAETLVLKGNELVEISAVAIPANPEAVRQAAAFVATVRAAVSTEGKQMVISATLTKALDVASGATEAEAVGRIQALTASETALHSLLAVMCVASASEAHGLFAGLKAKADNADVLAAKLEKVEQKQNETEIAALVEGARKAGKFTPANEPGYLDIAKGNIATLTALIAQLPVVANVEKAKTPAAPELAHGLTPALIAKCKANGWDPAEYAAMWNKTAGLARTEEDSL